MGTSSSIMCIGSNTVTVMPYQAAQKSSIMSSRVSAANLATSFLSPDDAFAIKSTWESVILAKKPDIFHKVFMRSIRKSPKMNEIMALGEYCVRDLSKWPKLNNISEAVKKFFDQIINKFEFSQVDTAQAAQSLGMRHAAYAQFGFQPHLLDIWTVSLIEIIDTIKMEEDVDKEQVCASWKVFMMKLVEHINQGYMQQRKASIMEEREERRESAIASASGSLLGNLGQIENQ